MSEERKCQQCTWWSERNFCFCPKPDKTVANPSTCPYWRLSTRMPGVVWGRGMYRNRYCASGHPGRGRRR